MKENILQKKIQLIMSQSGHRLFRCNTGLGWIGESAHFVREQTVFVRPGDVLIRRARPLHAGLCEGGSDLIGWTSTGKFLAIETKIEGNRTDKDRLEKQLNFIKQINNAGGVGIIAESVDEVINNQKLNKP